MGDRLDVLLLCGHWTLGDGFVVFAARLTKPMDHFVRRPKNIFGAGEHFVYLN